MAATAPNLDSSESPNPHGFLTVDADEVYCKTLSGQCNVYSLHRLRAFDVKKSDDWILVITLSGKLYRFSFDDATADGNVDSRSPTNSSLTVLCNEFDLRNEFPSHYVDLEVASSCLHQFADSGQTYLFLACVDNRSHLVDSGRNPSGGGSVSGAGIIFIVRIAPPWKPLAPLATVVRTLTTSYAPCLITVFPLRRSEGTADDQVLFVSGTDRSLHGYRIEMTSPDGSGGGRTRSGQISTCECFLGEALTEFDTLLRRGKPFPGAVLQLDVQYSKSAHFDRLTALGFDTGYLTVCHTDAIRNELVIDPVECRFDTPITALQFLPRPIVDASSALIRDVATPPLSPPWVSGTQMSLLVCPAIGPACLYANVDEPSWTETAVLTFPRSDQFDCITCAESITLPRSNGDCAVCYIILGTFSGKVLIYLLDRERTSPTLKRVHQFLSPVTKIRRFGQKYIAVLLIYTLMVFEY